MKQIFILLVILLILPQDGFANEFWFSSINFQSGTAYGEIKNVSGQDYSTAVFILEVRNFDKIIDSTKIFIYKFKHNQTRSYSKFIRNPYGNTGDLNIYFAYGYEEKQPVEEKTGQIESYVPPGAEWNPPVWSPPQ